MPEQSNEDEPKVLLISTIVSLITGCVGVTFSLISDSDAILLDGLFNLAYFAAGLVTIKIARLVQRGDDEHFPYGYAYFESLINGFKGLLVLGVSLMALVGAVDALLSGGRVVSAGPGIVYGVLASAACWSMAWVAHRGARRIGSPLVKADAENWLVNGAISSAVLMAFVGIWLIRDTGLAWLAPYVDPVLVVVVVMVSISVPVRMARQALMELLNRAPPAELVTHVRSRVADGLRELPVKELFVRVLQPGRTRMVLAHVVLPPDFQVGKLTRLDEQRAGVLEALRADYPVVVLDMIFTADSFWGAPMNGAAQSKLPSTT